MAVAVVTYLVCVSCLLTRLDTSLCRRVLLGHQVKGSATGKVVVWDHGLPTNSTPQSSRLHSDAWKNGMTKHLVEFELLG